jgi:ribosomal protein S13
MSLKGIGPKTAFLILSKLGLSKKTLIQDLLPTDLDKINLLISYLRNLNHFDGVFHPIENNLNLSVSNHIKSLFSCHSYKGSRLYLGYPANGQRTRSNANNSKKSRFIH